MKMYTRTGDRGSTSVIGGRMEKDHPRIQALGTIDELNSFVGMAIAHLPEERFTELRDQLEVVQHELFDCGYVISCVKGQGDDRLSSAATARLEQWMDSSSEELPALTKFILPGGSLAASTLHACRTICRRAERELVALAKESALPEVVMAYVNRLSDYFFVVARLVNHRLQMSDVVYVRSAEVFKEIK